MGARIVGFSAAVLWAALGLVPSGCLDQPELGTAGRLALAVAPLRYQAISDARYQLTITNGAGETVISHTLDSRRYGAGDGSLSFVGPCDASVGANDNVATLTLIDLYVGAQASVVPHERYVNPGPLSRTFTCEADADTALEFNLTVLRRADQGFFDVAVAFDDLFCSAKLDCVDAQGAPLELLHDAQGQRNTTVVLGFACTGAVDAGGETSLYRDPIVVTCDAGAATVDPSAGPGNLAMGSGISGEAGVLYGASVSRGEEKLGVHKLYWNVLLGLVDGATSCRLTTTASAADHLLSGRQTPANTTYPYLSWDVNLTAASGDLICTQHPLDGVGSAAGVATAYTPIDTPRTFAFAYLAGADAALEGLIAHWALSEASAGSCVSGADACDASGRGNDGAWVGGVSSVAGFIGRGVGLNGVDAYVARAVPEGWSGGDHSLTTMAWFKADAGFDSPNGRPVVAVGTTVNRHHFYTRAFSDPSWNSFNGCGGGASRITLGADDAGADMWHCSGVSAQLGRWTHVASSYDAATHTVALYVDGVLALSQALTAPLDLALPLYAGHDEHPTEFFSGVIDEVRFYDRALSADTIAAIVAGDQLAAGTCTNGLMDGDETAPDCGGRCTASCARDCAEILAYDPAATSGVYSLDPDGVGGAAPFDARCDMSDSDGGWTQLNASFLASLSSGLSYEYLFAFWPSTGAWYRSPTTSAVWDWDSYVAVNGSWSYSDTAGTLGSFACTSAEAGSWGVGCSNGGGPQWKAIAAYDKDPSLGTSKICQDQPDVFNAGNCASDVQVWVRQLP